MLWAQATAPNLSQSFAAVGLMCHVSASGLLIETAIHAAQVSIRSRPKTAA